MRYIKFITILYVCLWILFISTLACYSEEIKKTVSQSTSKENAIRKQQFTQCIKSGKSRSYCYYLYY